ncbi:hypothetical protein FDG50_00395 [Clostridium botulinum]|uniref:hypothetical protein n=1 Tax=Clostridium botulinum TaxID=1491 RepID=UPI0014007158|nr:hypothetical protein [Clostridium botulinum]MBY6835987.1 hypothetical protein [Clostridium botulinum]MBY6929794.1 hypothetical protein [Clostridium botulinum]NFG65771.1 hypothetical protein [Clostridium botulinum]NFQ22607.1 hypothetical protein [Clostridium botulinum]
MKKHDVLLRVDKVLSDLYNEINTEEWGYDEELYKKQMDDFFIISNALSELIQYRYNNSMKKEEYKEFVNNLIDKYLK